MKRKLTKAYTLCKSKGKNVAKTCMFSKHGGNAMLTDFVIYFKRNKLDSPYLIEVETGDKL